MSKKRDDVRWVTEYPVPRYFLGLLGRLGYRGVEAARIAQEQIYPYIRTESGAVPTINAFKSRMEKGLRYSKEMERIQNQEPDVDFIANDLLRQHLHRFQHLKINNYGIVSPADSSHESTKRNRARKVVNSLPPTRKGFKQVVAS